MKKLFFTVAIIFCAGISANAQAVPPIDEGFDPPLSLSSCSEASVVLYEYNSGQIDLDAADYWYLMNYIDTHCDGDGNGGGVRPPRDFHGRSSEQTQTKENNKLNSSFRDYRK